MKPKAVEQAVAMSEEDKGSGWVVEPPGSDAAVISLDIPVDAELTPEMRQALDNLVQAMESAGKGRPREEVEGFATSTGYTCPKETACKPLNSRPCARRIIVDCRIVPCTTYSLI